MNDKQGKALGKLIETVGKDESILALVLCGSLAKGTGTDASDIDVFVVVTDERFLREKDSMNLFWAGGCECAGLEVAIDGKLVPMDFFDKAWRVGNECIQSTLTHARVVYERHVGIADGIIVKPAGGGIDKAGRMRRFYSMMRSSMLKADDDPSNPMLVNKSILDTVFFACRLVLAHNDVLYPCIKNLYRELQECTMMPDGFIEMANGVLRSNSHDEMVAFYRHVDEYFKECRFDDHLRKGYVLGDEPFWYLDAMPYAVM